MPTHRFAAVATMEHGVRLLLQENIYPVTKIRHRGGDGPFVRNRMDGFLRGKSMNALFHKCRDFGAIDPRYAQDGGARPTRQDRHFSVAFVLTVEVDRFGPILFRLLPGFSPEKT